MKGKKRYQIERRNGGEKSVVLGRDSLTWSRFRAIEGGVDGDRERFGTVPVSKLRRRRCLGRRGRDLGKIRKEERNRTPDKVLYRLAFLIGADVSARYVWEIGPVNGTGFSGKRKPKRKCIQCELGGVFHVPRICNDQDRLSSGPGNEWHGFTLSLQSFLSSNITLIQTIMQNLEYVWLA